MSKRPPPKSRREQRCDCHRTKRAKAESGKHSDQLYAPSHLGGQFEESGYRSGSGQFGFSQYVT